MDRSYDERAIPDALTDARHAVNHLVLTSRSLWPFLMDEFPAHEHPKLARLSEIMAEAWSLLHEIQADREGG